MNRSKIIIAALAAMLVVALAPAAAQAASKAKQIEATQQVQVTTTNVAQEVQAGSAGIDGYSDERCEKLAKDFNLATDIVMQEQQDGTPNSSRAVQAHHIAGHAEKEMTDNCLVIY